MDFIRTETLLDRDFDIYGDVNDPWFDAVQVARAIDYSGGNTGQMLRLVHPDDKLYVRLSRSTPYSLRGTSSRGQGKGGGNPNRWLVNENGLFDILMRSDKPISRDLRLGLRNILKNLRRGGYLTNTEQFLSLSQADISEILVAVHAYDISPQFAVRYYSNLNKGMTEKEALRECEEFIDAVIAGKIPA